METADSNYGSDRYGLVWGYVLGAGREAAPIDSEGAARWLATAASAEPDRFVWLHFSLANAACRSWLRSNLELPDAFHDELREGTGSTRLERDGDALGAEDVQDLREAAEEFSVAVADSAALGERVKLLQEELAATVSERTGRTLFVLTIVTVLALPINLLAGLFGMNVGGIPFAEDGSGFWTVVATLVAFTAAMGLPRPQEIPGLARLGSQGAALARQVLLPQGQVRYMFGTLGYAFPTGTVVPAVAADSAGPTGARNSRVTTLGMRLVRRQVAARDHKIGKPVTSRIRRSMTSL